jgi:hypothetical protein
VEVTVLRRIILGVVLMFGVTGSPAWASSKHADASLEKARQLAKKGRTLEAASELRVAAETAGADGPMLRFEAALMLQRSGETRDAMTLHDEVSRDSGAAFALRVQARYAEEILFWNLEFSALAGPALDRLTSVRAESEESARRCKGAQAEDAELTKRLREVSQKINESRRSLSSLVGPDDPMIKELDTLANACSDQQSEVLKLNKATSEASRAVAAAKRSLGTLNKGIEALSAFAKAQAAWAKRGVGALRPLKKQHDALLKRGLKAAQGGVGALSSVAATIAGANLKLVERDKVAEQIEGVVSAGEIVLGAGP